VAVLRPWRRVFDPRDWDALLRRAVLPKLEAALRTDGGGLSLRPDAPRTAPLRWAAAWAGAAPDDALAALFERAVWPQAHAVLRYWLLALPDDDDGGEDKQKQRAKGLAEAAAWLARVAALAPAEVRAHARGRAALGALLRLLGAAADGAPLPDVAGSVPGAAGPLPPPARGGPDGTSRWDEEEEEEEDDDPLAAAARRAGASSSSAAAAASLRELVARFAADAGLDFTPRPGRSHMGLPVYSFGGVSVVLQPHAGATAASVAGGGGGLGGGGVGGGTLLARRSDGRWAAASLQELVEMAGKR
jgi:tuftelin-interacting protein 11